MTLRVQEDLPERYPRVDTVAVWVLIQKSCELLFGRFDLAPQIIRNEIQFLANTTANDRVIFIQAHLHAFAVGDLFANIIVDQSFELDASRRPLPGARKERGQMLDLSCRNYKTLGGGTGITLQIGITTENRSPQSAKNGGEVPKGWT